MDRPTLTLIDILDGMGLDYALAVLRAPRFRRLSRRMCAFCSDQAGEPSAIADRFSKTQSEAFVFFAVGMFWVDTPDNNLEERHEAAIAARDEIARDYDRIMRRAWMFKKSTRRNAEAALYAARAASTQDPCVASYYACAALELVGEDRGDVIRAQKDYLRELIRGDA